MSHVSGVQNKYQISNHSWDTKQQAQIQVCHVGFSSVNRYKLHILSKIACVYLTFNTGLFFYVYHLGNSFLLYYFIKLFAKLHVSLSSRAFHLIEVTYCVTYFFTKKTFVYLSKTLNYSVCVKGEQNLNLCPGFCT